MGVNMDRVLSEAAKVAAFLGTLGPEADAAKKALSNTVAEISNKVAQGEELNYDVVAVTPDVPEGMRFLHLLRTYGIDDGTSEFRVFHVYTHTDVMPELLPYLHENLVDNYPALLQIRKGMPVSHIEGIEDITKYLRSVGALKKAPEDAVKVAETPARVVQPKFRRNTTQCGAKVNTGVTYKKKCCGNKVRDVEIAVCPQFDNVTHRHCIQCKVRHEPGTEISAETATLLAEKVKAVREKSAE